MAQSLPPEVEYGQTIYSARGSSQIESMIKNAFTGEVEIDKMTENENTITFSNAKYEITLDKDIGDILETIKSNYGL